jgi:hypothetical protein
MESAGGATWYRIEFYRQAEPGRQVLLEFLDPVPAAAVSTSQAIDAIPSDAAPAEMCRVGRAERAPPPAAFGEGPADGLEVMAVVSGSEDEARWCKELRGWVTPRAEKGDRSNLCHDHASMVPAGGPLRGKLDLSPFSVEPCQERPAVAVKNQDVRVWWGPHRAAILAPAGQLQGALLAVVELAFYEAELSRLEAQTAAAWPEADKDTPLAYDVTAADLARQDVLGRRMAGVFERRIRQTRIEPHLRRAAAALPPAARRLGDLLRRKAKVPERVEALDGKTEVYEYIYELASQRMGEYRNSRRERHLEIIIIVILAIETLAMVIDGFITWWASPD